MINEILPNGTDAPRDVVNEDGDVRSIEEFIELTEDAEDLKQAIEDRNNDVAEQDAELGRLAVGYAIDYDQAVLINDAYDHAKLVELEGEQMCGNCTKPGCRGCGRR